MLGIGFDSSDNAETDAGASIAEPGEHREAGRACDSVRRRRDHQRCRREPHFGRDEHCQSSAIFHSSSLSERKFFYEEQAVFDHGFDSLGNKLGIKARF